MAGVMIEIYHSGHVYKSDLNVSILELFIFTPLASPLPPFASEGGIE